MDIDARTDGLAVGPSLHAIQRQLAAALAEAPDGRAAAGCVLDALLAVEGVDSGAVYRLDGRTGVAELAAHAGLPPGWADAHRRLDAGSEAARALAGEYVPATAGVFATAPGLHPVGLFPLRHGTRVLGGLWAGSHAFATPAPGAVDAVASLARLAAGELARLELRAALARSEAGLEALCASADDLVAVVDPGGRVLDASPGLARRLGWSVDDLRAAHLVDLYPPDAREAAARSLADAWTGVAGVSRQPLLCRAGALVPAEVRSVRASWQGRDAVWRISPDLAERGRVEAALGESEERLELVVAGVRDGVWHWDARTGRVELSPHAHRVLDLPEDEGPRTLADVQARVHPEDLPRLLAAIRTQAREGWPVFEHEQRIRTGDGGLRWILARGAIARDPRGRIVRMAGSVTDVTETRLHEERVTHVAFHDGLTGLPNRGWFNRRLEQCIAITRRANVALHAVLCVDLDRFTVINDSLGPGAGEAVLKEAAARLVAAVRPGDTVARIGDDEFAVLLECVRHVEDATRVATRVLEAIARPIPVPGGEVEMTASIGIALSESGYDRAETMLRDADIALGRAKTEGGARFAVFDRAMHRRIEERLSIESDLRGAQARGELELFFQPLVTLESWRVVGVEALLRWRHPARGLVLPADFIGVAEESGLILPIGRWVLREACRQAAAWPAGTGGHAPYISVNVSARQLLVDDLAAAVADSLAESGLEPGRLILEITESLLVDDRDDVRRKLEAIRALGVRIHLDDFGTGYSALGYLHRFPIDSLKIDRSFTKGITERKRGEIVKAIVALARALQLGVTAEGVETALQVDILKAMGCEVGQGHLFSRPLEEGPLHTLLREEFTAPVAMA